MASAKQAEASRINGAKSKGPKTDAGKARSAANSTTHGLTSQPDIITDSYLEWLRAWIADQKPDGVVEMALVERACRAAWRLDLCARHHDAAVGQRARSAADRHDRSQATRVNWLGRLLFARIEDHHGQRPAMIGEGDDPGTLVAELESTAQGAAWLLKQWAELGRVLDDVGYWDAPRKVAAVRMLGMRPEDVMDDPVVFSIYAACHALVPGYNLLWSDCYDVAVIHPDISADNLRFDEMEANAPDDAGAGPMLRAIVDHETDRLTRRKLEVLDDRAAADRDGAADRALFDDAPATALMLRYEGASSRDLTRSLTELQKLRKEAAREDTGSSREAARPRGRKVEPVPCEASPPTPPPTAPATAAFLPNEPGATVRKRPKGKSKSAGNALPSHTLGRTATVGDSHSPRPRVTRIASAETGAVAP